MFFGESRRNVNTFHSFCRYNVIPFPCGGVWGSAILALLLLGGSKRERLIGFHLLVRYYYGIPFPRTVFVPVVFTVFVLVALPLLLLVVFIVGET